MREWRPKDLEATRTWVVMGFQVAGMKVPAANAAGAMEAIRVGTMVVRT